uniref:NADH-ubiquinone oxidoreductase chain 2 n=1 Tax=Loxoblemmus doenitzi TaxID=209185 RepID=A0A1J0M4H2_9ORTH|nr:NADH dehydrogenase subunit 2 [Loxoblemmus doenitzi]APD14908.1 NADH dehydrogenase subunit 2 [Loxoblemmus doenitzi]AQM39928.1 NADH dehydrogenase subunit 2 [Loxoblemmus doenitzi]
MLMLNPSKFLFLMMLILGTLISISSNSWPATWIGLEINLLAFIPLMSSKDSMMSTEASMKYFIVQAMASSMLLTLTISNFMFTFITSELMNSIIATTLLIKMGAAPFHMWFPSVMEGLSWMNCLILMTWQKLAPFVILSYLNFNHQIMIFVMLFSVIIGSIGGLNQTSTRKIMAYSSINHIGWMILALTMSENLWQIYYMIYTVLSSAVIMIFHNMSSQHVNQLSLNWLPSISKFVMLISLLSLGGLPPFLGFLPKWLVIQSSIYSQMWFTITAMILITLMTLFYYLRLAMTSFLMSSTQPNWNQKLSNKFIMSKSTSMLSMISMTTLPLYTVLFYGS